MADLIADVVSRWEKAGPLISPRQIRVWARGVCSRNVHLARLLGQSADMTAEKLVGQYYRMRGLCAETGIPMLHSSESSPLAIELDHIVSLNRMKSLEAAFSGTVPDQNGGLAAAMNNVRLVCRIAHRMRHQAENQGIDFTVFCSRLYSVSTQGCCIDPTVELNHQSSEAVREKAQQLIDGLLSDANRFHSLDTVCEMLERNHLPLTLNEVRSLMTKKLGTNLNTYRSRFRLAVIRSVIESNSVLRSEFVTIGCTANITEAINQGFINAGMTPITKVGMLPYFRRLGISAASAQTQTGKPRQKNAVNSASRSSLWAFAKSMGIRGFSQVDVQQQFPSWGDTLVVVALEDAIARNLIEEKQGRLFGRVNRAEAARLLSLTAQVLKKYAVMGKAPPHLLGKPGCGVEATYSIHDLVDWRRLHPAQNRIAEIEKFMLSGV
jgi:hypothetical protein